MIDVFVVMPDHVHGMLFTGTNPDAEPATVGDVVRWFKASVHAGYRDGVRRACARTPGVSPCEWWWVGSAGQVVGQCRDGKTRVACDLIRPPIRDRLLQ